MPKQANQIIFIVGPTGVGKSDVAVHVARKLGGEIISCDSMQIYREVSVANNKPPRAVLDEIPHYMVGICSIAEEHDVALYHRQALACIQEIHERSRWPIVVGGSGLYMEVLLDGIFSGGQRNEPLRSSLMGQARDFGNAYLHERLREADPGAAERIHPNDLRRTVRALEVSIQEQAPISEKRCERTGAWGTYDIQLFCLNRDRAELYHLIDQRVERMFAEGLLEEIKRLNNAPWSRTAEKIIGVREIRRFLTGQGTLDEAKEAIKQNTRHLAKRQLTWFRRDSRLQWIMIKADDTAETVAQIIINKCHAGKKARRYESSNDR